jgi:hypothetical protein
MTKRNKNQTSDQMNPRAILKNSYYCQINLQVQIQVWQYFNNKVGMI